MVRRRSELGCPADHVRGAFPDGALRRGAPVPARYARHVALALREALAERKVADVSQRAGLARTTVYDLLTGQTWPDLVTLAALEDVLDVQLWPSRA